MICPRCRRRYSDMDSSQYSVGIETLRGRATVYICDDCNDKLQSWLVGEPVMEYR